MARIKDIVAALQEDWLNSLSDEFKQFLETNNLPLDNDAYETLMQKNIALSAYQRDYLHHFIKRWNTAEAGYSEQA